MYSLNVELEELIHWILGINVYNNILRDAGMESENVFCYD